MNEPVPINKVSTKMSISSRTLRYWESVGLFQSTRDSQSGWRVYDEQALQSIRLIDLLRRLDISISDIKEIVENKSAEAICLILEKQLNKLGSMGSDIELRKKTISELIEILRMESILTLSSLENILVPVAPVTLIRNKCNVTKMKEDISMGSIESKYNEIQFIKLPPMRTAAYSCAGVEPEDEAVAPVRKWVEENNLLGTMRLFGFNVEPYPTKDNPSYYGFGYCASIPEGIVIPEPLHEMRLPGGIYAVISQYKGDPSNGWKIVHELFSNDEWGWSYDNDRHPGLEEHIEREDGKGFIISILVPVKKKEK